MADPALHRGAVEEVGRVLPDQRDPLAVGARRAADPLLGARDRDHVEVGLGENFVEALDHLGEGRHALDNVVDGRVDGVAPGQRLIQHGMGLFLDQARQRRVAGRQLGVGKVAQRLQVRDLDAPRHGQRIVHQQIQAGDQNRKAVGAAVYGR